LSGPPKQKSSVCAFGMGHMNAASPDQAAKRFDHPQSWLQ
jgi:hypothetical protein